MEGEIMKGKDFFLSLRRREEYCTLKMWGQKAEMNTPVKRLYKSILLSLKPIYNSSMQETGCERKNDKLPSGYHKLIV